MVTVLSTLFTILELGKPSTIQYVNDLLVN